jgi:hypothetical protein
MRLLIVSVAALLLSGCMSYAAVSVGSVATTGRGLTDNAASVATGNDCNTIKLVAGRQDYYCERPREPGTTYNRSAF